MTPVNLESISAIVKILGDLAGWPFAMVVFSIIVGPWIAAFILVNIQTRRFESVVTMYQNNVILVENYEKLAKDLHDVVIMNTQIIQRLVDDIKTNQYCPYVRLEKRAKGAVA
jgi:hypothetical protein